MATANPQFDLQHQAISSLKQVHHVCIATEVAQVFVSFIIMLLGLLASRSTELAPATNLMRNIHMFTAMFYFFIAIFAHIVVYYVLLAMGRNVKNAYHLNPENVSVWLVTQTSRQKFSLIPYFLAHSICLVASALTQSFWAVDSHHHTHLISSILSTLIGIVVTIRIWFALKQNTSYLTLFVTNGGFTWRPNKNL